MWSSCPPEFGTNAVLERFTQIEPTVFFTADTYRYAGKTIAIYEKVQTILASLPSVRHVVVTGHLFLDREPREAFPAPLAGMRWLTWNAMVKIGEGGPDQIAFRRSSAMVSLRYLIMAKGQFGLTHTSRSDSHFHSLLVWNDWEAESHRACRRVTHLITKDVE